MHKLILNIIKSNMSESDKLAAIAAISGGVEARKALYRARVQNGANKRRADALFSELVAEYNK